MEALIKYDDDTSVNMKDVDGSTPLHLAAENGNTKVVSFLLKKGAIVDEKNKFFWTPLHLAAKNGIYKIFIRFKHD